MKVEELHIQERQSQVGVIFQRVPFEAKIDIFPDLNPLLKSDSNVPTTMSELTSEETRERLCKVVKHRMEDDGGFRAIPLKRLDSQHCIQESSTEIMARPSVPVSGGTHAPHRTLLDEIDNDETKAGKGKSLKKESTFTRVLKGIRMEKDEVGANNGSVRKLFQRMNPVGKASRENMSKVFQRIGDALQKKSDEGDRVKSNVLVYGSSKQEDKVDEPKEYPFSKLGERVMKLRSTEVDKTS